MKQCSRLARAEPVINSVDVHVWDRFLGNRQLLLDLLTNGKRKRQQQTHTFVMPACMLACITWCPSATLSGPPVWSLHGPSPSHHQFFPCITRLCVLRGPHPNALHAACLLHGLSHEFPFWFFQSPPPLPPPSLSLEEMPMRWGEEKELAVLCMGGVGIFSSDPSVSCGIC